VPFGIFEDQSETKIAPRQETRSDVRHSRVNQGKRGGGVEAVSATRPKPRRGGGVITVGNGKPRSDGSRAIPRPQHVGAMAMRRES
jgi:hypothetical protein